MNRLLFYVLFLLAILALPAWFYLNEQETVDMPYQASALSMVGNECEIIAEKAAMQLPQVLPFQKLEKIARQMRVFETCMKDRAYTENPQWDTFAQQLAKKTAAAGNVSQNEAYENLRRQAMLVYTKRGAMPIYWVLSKAQLVNNEP